MVSEKAIEQSILQFISYLPPDIITCWKNNTTGIYDDKKGVFRLNPGTVRGVADILGVVKQRVGKGEVGVFLALEVKASSGGRVSPVQAQFIKQINALGGVAGIVTSVEDTIQLLQENFHGFEDLSA